MFRALKTQKFPRLPGWARKLLLVFFFFGAIAAISEVPFLRALHTRNPDAFAVVIIALPVAYWGRALVIRRNSTPEYLKEMLAFLGTIAALVCIFVLTLR